MNIQLINSIFSNNLALRGAGVAFVDVEPYLLNCVFTNNTALQEGGGIYFLAETTNSTILVLNSSFNSNIAKYGGAIFLGNASFGQVDEDKWNVTFTGN